MHAAQWFPKCQLLLPRLPVCDHRDPEYFVLGSLYSALGAPKLYSRRRTNSLSLRGASKHNVARDKVQSASPFATAQKKAGTAPGIAFKRG